MAVYTTLFDLLSREKHNSDLITNVRKLPDNKILLDCNFARSATLHIVDNKVYIDADEQLKSQLDQYLNKLLKRR